MPRLPWLKPVKFRRDSQGNLVPVYRRTLKDKGHRREPHEIYELITRKVWPYKTNRAFYKLRDQAFLALLYVCAGRVGEILSLVKEQFSETEDFLIIKNYKVEKQKVETFREEFPIAKKGALQPFAKIIVAYLSRIEKGKLFNFKRARGHQICKYITGKWPHWLRAMGEAYYGRIFKDSLKLGQFLQVKKLETLREYIPFEWRDYEKDLLQ